MGIDLDPDARARVDAELEPGEHLLWAGTGRVGRVGLDALTRLMSRQGVPMIVIPIAIAVVVGLVAMRGMHAPFAGLMLGLVILVMLMSPVMMFRGIAGQVMKEFDAPLLYALTDRRALVWTPDPLGRGVAVRSFVPEQMNASLRVDRPDGTGDLVFHESWGGPGRGVIRHGFYGIPAPATVERLLRQVRERRTPPPLDPDSGPDLPSS